MTTKREGWVSIEQAAMIMSTTPAELRRLSQRRHLPAIDAGQVPFVLTLQAYVRYLRDPIDTQRELGDRLGISEAMVRKLIGDGFIPRAPGGGVPHFDGLAGYIKFQLASRRRSSEAVAEVGLRAARQREIEVRIAEREHRLIETDEAMAIIEEIVDTYRAEFVELPTRVTRDIPLRQKVEAEVDASLTRVSKLFRRREAQVRTAGSVSD